jgi:hypothetical protein
MRTSNAGGTRALPLTSSSNRDLTKIATLSKTPATSGNAMSEMCTRESSIR